MGTLRDKLIDLIAPRKCVFCGALVDSDLPCARCQRELPWLVGKQAEREVEFVSLCVSALRYQDPVRHAVHRLKFGRRSSFLRTLGPLTAQCAQDHLTGRFDLVTWVPLSAQSLRRRGFDQAELLAGYVARAFGMEPVSLLAKRKGVGQQSLLGEASHRRANVLGAYRVTRPELAEGKRVLIVDDVVTSGATLSECARMLRMAGCREVTAVTLAKAREGERQRRQVSGNY